MAFFMEMTEIKNESAIKDFNNFYKSTYDALTHLSICFSHLLTYSFIYFILFYFNRSIVKRFSVLAFSFVLPIFSD